MIQLNTAVLKHARLPSNIMASVALMVHTASDAPDAKPSEALAYDFLLSFKGNAKINLAELLRHFGYQDISNCIQLEGFGFSMNDFWSNTDHSKKETL